MFDPDDEDPDESEVVHVFDVDDGTATETSA